jgi:Ca2+-binding RTX toxin-like protein
VIVVARGSTGGVDALGGNDVICLVDGPPAPGPSGDVTTFVATGGPGDDVIVNLVTRAFSSLTILPGAGHDVVYGGAEAELVNGGDPSAGSGGRDVEADEFHLGYGGDTLITGARGYPNPDVVDLGPGDDSVVYAGTGTSASGLIDGGPGHDVLRPSSLDLVDPPAEPVTPGRVVLDNRAGRSWVDGAAYLRWSGFEEFELHEFRHSRLRFTGSAADERLWLGEGRQRVDLRGGDDVVSNSGRLFPRGRVLGGRGNDTVRVSAWDSADVDLRGRVRTTYRTRKVTGHVHGFEVAEVSATVADVRGTNRSDTIRVAAYRAAVSAAGGRDLVELSLRPITRQGQRRSLARGGPGKDRLVGTDRDDVLLGGAGRDTAVGGNGRDDCDAEVRRSCEVRR